MKILCISDITLNVLKKNIEIEYPAITIDLVYTESLLVEISNKEIFSGYDIFYVHVDTLFRQYDDLYLSQILEALYNFTQRTSKVVLCSNLLISSRSGYSLSNSSGFIQNSTLSLYDLLNMLRELPNFYFVDLTKTVLNIGIVNTYNYNLGHLYQMPYNKRFLFELKELLVNFINKLNKADKKVIVLDCDNTLWKGIVGEDTIKGIVCDLSPEGIIYSHFQRFLLRKKDEGFLLAICSKNNEDDVFQVLMNGKMPLKWEDFVVKKVNWLDKAENIKSIATELNVGLDSFIFIDDSDFEINSIKYLLPEVHCIQFIDDYNYLIKMMDNFVFYKKSITKEDIDKSKFYHTEAIRVETRRKSTSLNEYIESLQIKFDISCNPESDWDRIAQLTEKTNQFNFNKRPYSVSELIDLVTIRKFRIYTVSVSDKFGDYGLVGLLIVSFEEDAPILENYILSCRVLGRGVEKRVFETVSDLIRNEFGQSFAKINFKKTQKNAPAEIFLNQINFIDGTN